MITLAALVVEADDAHAVHNIHGAVLVAMVRRRYGFGHLPNYHLKY
jgi:hypothetical protein